MLGLRVAVLLVALSGTAVAERDLTLTTTLDLAIGAADVGRLDGFVAPCGHFDFGATLGDLRLQGEADTGLWTNEGAPPEAPESGRFTRLGVGVRWYWRNLETRSTDHRKTSRLRLYVEGGLGRQQVKSTSVDLARNDLAFGFGMAQEARLGGVILGGHFGIRVLAANAPDQHTNVLVACRGGCPGTPASHGPRHDLALFFLLGVVFGR